MKICDNAPWLINWQLLQKFRRRGKCLKHITPSAQQSANGHREGRIVVHDEDGLLGRQQSKGSGFRVQGAGSKLTIQVRDNQQGHRRIQELMDCLACFTQASVYSFYFISHVPVMVSFRRLS
jgi:hypothetical protein